MVKLDKDSNVIWSYLGQTHHDFDMGADGRIYALTHEMRRTTYERHPQLMVPRLDDFVVVLSPEGEELKKVSVLDALAGSQYGWLLNRVAWYNKHDRSEEHTSELQSLMRISYAVFCLKK